jgi:hypothetical protein
MNFPSAEIVAQVRAQYPIGSTVELISMSDPYTKIPPGTRGSVTDIDDAGTVFVRWSCGSGLGVVYGVDEIRRVDADAL